MNKIAQGLLGATAVILLLAGCSAVSAEAQDAPSVAPSASSQPSATPSTSGPVTVAPSQAPAVLTSGTVPNGEALLVKYLHGDGVLVGVGNISDADLLKAGRYACDLFAQGQTYDKMDVIQGDDAAPGRNDKEIAGLASQTLCVQYDISK